MEVGHAQSDLFIQPKRPWNAGRLIGPKAPLKPKHIWAIRQQLKVRKRVRDLAMFNCALDSKLRACDLVRLRVSDVAPGGVLRLRSIIQQKTGRPERGRRSTGGGDDRLDLRQSAPLGERWKRGASLQAIGCSRGGCTTKVHLLVDEAGRPRVVQLSPGQASDIVVAHDLVLASAPSQSLLADRAYDGDALRRLLTERGTTPVIPNKINRVNRHPFDAAAYRLRNTVERTFCRLKDFRAVATRYDKTARNYLAGLCLVAAITL